MSDDDDVGFQRAFAEIEGGALEIVLTEDFDDGRFISITRTVRQHRH